MKENRVEEVVKTHAEGFSCAQALLAVYGPELGMDRETALKVAGGFGGGMGRMAGTCGAVTGAFMVIGLVHSMTKKGDLQQKELSYEYHSEVRRNIQGAQQDPCLPGAHGRRCEHAGGFR